MGLRYPDQKHCGCFFVTTTYNDWSNYSNIPGLYEKLCNSLTYCADKYNARIAAYSLMPSHIHLLLFIKGNKLSDFMRDFKKYISQKVMADFGISEAKIWKSRFDRVAIESRKVFLTKLNYIHKNPVKDGLVSNIEDWKWSSAADYFTDRKGLIEIWKGW